MTWVSDSLTNGLIPILVYIYQSAWNVMCFHFPVSDSISMQVVQNGDSESVLCRD